MRITVELPDDVAGHAEPGREALEALVVQGYRDGTLSHHQASQLLGVSRLDFDAFLKKSGIYEHAYGIADLDRDLEDLRRFDARNPPGRS
jgi:predicted HTH domain antitoxin